MVNEINRKCDRKLSKNNKYHCNGNCPNLQFTFAYRKKTMLITLEQRNQCTGTAKIKNDKSHICFTFITLFPST